MPKLTLTIITQEKHVLTESVDQVSVPSLDGELTILAEHAALFTRLTDGILSYTQGEKKREMAVLGGFMDVAPGNQVTVMSDAAVLSEEASEEKAMKAKAEAEKVMANKDGDVTPEIQRQAEAALRQAILELKVARRLKK